MATGSLCAAAELVRSLFTSSTRACRGVRGAGGSAPKHLGGTGGGLVCVRSRPLDTKSNPAAALQPARDSLHTHINSCCATAGWKRSSTHCAPSRALPVQICPCCDLARPQGPESPCATRHTLHCRRSQPAMSLQSAKTSVSVSVRGLARWLRSPLRARGVPICGSSYPCRCIQSHCPAALVHLAPHRASPPSPAAAATPSPAFASHQT